MSSTDTLETLLERGREQLNTIQQEVREREQERESLALKIRADFFNAIRARVPAALMRYLRELDPGWTPNVEEVVYFDVPNCAPIKLFCCSDDQATWTPVPPYLIPTVSVNKDWNSELQLHLEMVALNWVNALEADTPELALAMAEMMHRIRQESLAETERNNAAALAAHEKEQAKPVSMGAFSPREQAEIYLYGDGNSDLIRILAAIALSIDDLKQTSQALGELKV